MKIRKFTKLENAILDHASDLGKLIEVLPEQGEPGRYRDVERLIDHLTSITETIFSRPVNDKFLRQEEKREERLNI